MHENLLDFLLLYLGKKALWANRQHQEHDDVGRYFLESGGEIGPGQLFGTANDQAADQGAGKAAETADDGSRKRFDADESHLRAYQ